MVTAAHLRLLQRRGLDLRQTNRNLQWLAIIDPYTPTPSAIKLPHEAVATLCGEIASQLNVTNHPDAVARAQDSLMAHNARVVESTELREPSDTIVREIQPDSCSHNEAEYFAAFYAEPVRGMVVSDRYLEDRDRIVKRLGAHIALAHQQGALEWVLVRTRKKEGNDQQQALSQLKSQFPFVKIKFEYDYHTAHDRFIEVTRVNGQKSRVIIGRGLEFILPNGAVEQTFLVFQNI